MMNKSINLNSSGKHSNNKQSAVKKSNASAGFGRHSQIEETKSEGYLEGDEEDEELKQMSKSTVWTQNIYTSSQQEEISNPTSLSKTNEQSK